jgi:hypothetical protein
VHVLAAQQSMRQYIIAPDHNPCPVRRGEGRAKVQHPEIHRTLTHVNANVSIARQLKTNQIIASTRLASGIAFQWESCNWHEASDIDGQSDGRR